MNRSEAKIGRRGDELIPERSVDSRRQLPDADDFSSPPLELAGDVAVAGYVGLAFAVPDGAVRFQAGVALAGNGGCCLCRQAA